MNGPGGGHDVDGGGAGGCLSEEREVAESGTVSRVGGEGVVGPRQVRVDDRSTHRAAPAAAEGAAVFEQEVGVGIGAVHRPVLDGASEAGAARNEAGVLGTDAAPRLLDQLCLVRVEAVGDGGVGGSGPGGDSDDRDAGDDESATASRRAAAVVHRDA